MIAGVVIETLPGAEPEVAARLLRVPGVTLLGGDGHRRVAAVVEIGGARTLEEWAEELIRRDEKVLGVFPTFVGDEAPSQ